MAISDYNVTALEYKAKFDALNRPSTVALVPENEEFNRDELLHFIEAYLKSGVKGGITPDNLRAVLHTIVKSSLIKQDDERNGILFNKSLYVSTGAANRWYYGSYNYGWDFYSWSQYVVYTNLSSSTLPSISGIYHSLGVDVPFPLYNFTVCGTIAKTSGTGEVKIILYYADNDTNSYATLQNVTFLTEVSVNCDVANTGYAFSESVAASTIIPQGKKIYAFINNNNWSAGEALKLTLTYKYTSKVSASTSFSLSR